MIEDVSASDFHTIVRGARLPVLVDFYTPSCGPCRKLLPTLQQIASVHTTKLKVIKVDISNAFDLCRQFRIQSVPAIALFYGGAPARWTFGYPPNPSIESMLVGYV